MSKQVIIAEQYRIAAVFSEDQIEEIIVAAGTHQVGDVYMGVVENILKGIDAAFVNIGDGDRNGFIHISDLGPLKLRRNADSISDLLSPQQRVLVQVMKEPTGNKGPRLTGNISMPGRYAVLLPYGRGVNLSKRVRSEPERNRLRALGILVKPAGMGLLLRTEAEGVPEDAIIEDLENLQRQWEAIQQDASSTRSPSLLSRDRDFVQKVLRDAYSTEVNRIVTDSPDGLKRVKQHLLNWGEGKIPPGLFIDYHRERTSILEYFRVNAAIREAMKPRVDLPSGGYVIIQPTEALTVVDVNSGSFTRSQTSRETVLWTNCEAAKEVARQIRLRNIAGIIIVDFIDMDTRRDQLQLLEEFNKALRADKSRPQIAQLTELGLVEMTRKRQGQSIYELFGQQCAACSGLGVIARLPGEPATQVTEMVNHNHQTWESQFVAEFGKDDGLLADDDDDSPLSGGIDPNLINHPSYQERGGSSTSGSRRGRRRTRDSEKPSEVRLRRQEVRIEPRAESRQEVRTEIRAEPKSEPREILPRVISLPAVASSKVAAAFEPIEAPEQVVPERQKRETPRARQEPPETIIVEMSTEEQEVYAHLGISPLVMIDRDIKDARNAIISVMLPGTAPEIKPENSPAIAPPIENPELEDLQISEPEFDLSLPFSVEPEPIADPDILERKFDNKFERKTLEKEEPQPIEDYQLEVLVEKEEVKIQSPAASRRRRSTS